MINQKENVVFVCIGIPPHFLKRVLEQSEKQGITIDKFTRNALGCYLTRIEELVHKGGAK